jgi:phosphoribosylanthranilate isomerase
LRARETLSPESKQVAVKVKICGVRTPAIIETAATEGADYVGLVLFERSPRNVEIEEARVLAAVARGKIGAVAVLVDPDDALIEGVAHRVRPDLIQLHGNETPERVTAIKTRTGLPVIKAIPVAEASDVGRAETYAGIADFILFDAKAAPDAMRPGGFGESFDWTLLRDPKAPFALSGGLTPDNVGEAVRLTGASLVDVSSGVESEAGVKDARLVRSFVQAAKAASSAPKAKAS